MKTFEQLSEQEQDAARAFCLENLLRDILEGGLRFDDGANENYVQSRIDVAWAKAEDMQTPWFANEYIMEAVGDDLRSMAQCDAEAAQYAGVDDAPVIRLPLG